jgi:hypothetical protein
MQMTDDHSKQDSAEETLNRTLAQIIALSNVIVN